MSGTADQQMEMPCLGRPFQLGTLYDFRNDSLIPGVTLWGPETLGTATCTKMEGSDFEVVTKDSLNEKALHLDVSAGLKLSVLGGLVKAGGSGKFLYDRTTSKNQARVSLKYRATSRFEQLNMSHLGKFEYPRVFDDDIATHVVTGVQYGADAIFVFDRQVESSENLRQVHGKMETALLSSKYFKVEGEADLDLQKTEKNEMENCRCKFYGDFILNSNPTTYQDAVRVCQELPMLLGGAGYPNSVPKKVWLYPLSRLDSKVQRMVREISSCLIDDLQDLMESMHELEVRNNDLIRNEVCDYFAKIKGDLEKLKRLIGSYKVEMLKKMATLLPQVRGGGAKEAELAELFEENAKSPFSFKQLSLWVSRKEEEVGILSMYLEVLKKNQIQLVFSSSEMISLTCGFDEDAILCFDFNLSMWNDSCLQGMEAYLHGRTANKEPQVQKDWYKTQMMRQAFRQFVKFVKINASRQGVKYVATNGDTIESDKVGLMVVYEDGCPTEFEPPDQPGKPCISKTTHNSIQLKWAKPKHGAQYVQSYTVIYQAADDSPDQWCTQTSDEECVEVTNLVPGSLCSFKVVAETNVGSSPASEVSEVRLPPGQPGKPHTSETTYNSVQLNWLKPKHGTDIVQSYTISCCFKGDSSVEQWSTQTSSDECTVFTDLMPGSLYWFKVTANSPAGTSPASEVSEIRLPPCQPSKSVAGKVRAESTAEHGPESELSDSMETTLPPPGKPHASNVTHNSLQLNWEKPSHGAGSVQFYIVFYRTVNSLSDQWNTKKTLTAVASLELFNLIPQNVYHFKVRGESATGPTPYSDLSDPIETNAVSWGGRIYKTFNPMPNSNPPTYLLPTHCVMKKNDVVKVHIGGKSHDEATSGVYTSCSCHTRTAGVPHKVLMLVGATGAGKTALINGIANYILGVQWDDDFRFKLIDEPTLQDHSPSKSQTSCITAYTYKEEGSPLPYTLTVIDTPGFGARDTAGLERDKYIVSQIKELFSIPGDEGIDQLHGIGFVTQGPLARLTPTQRYVFDAILSVFGKDVADNIFLMITFADGMKPPVLDTVKAAGVPYKAFFKFNNSALFASKSADDKLIRMFWKMGTESFDEFFKQLLKAKPQSLQQTREVIQGRDKLETIIQNLQPQIQAGLLKVDELRQEKQILKKHEADILSNKDFTYRVQVTKQRYVILSSGTYTTNCLVCNYTCHANCPYPDNDDKYKCTAMSVGRGTESARCGVCPGKCSWKRHKDSSYRFEYYTKSVTKTSDDLKKKYESAMNSKDKTEEVINTLRKELDALTTAVLHKKDQARTCIEHLQQIALKPDHLTEVEYIDCLIESEKREAKDRWLEHVQALEGVRKQAKIVAEVIENPKGSFFNVEDSPKDNNM